MIIAFTGHTNIEKACGKTLKSDGEVYDNEAHRITKEALEDALFNKAKAQKGDTIISGMARGVDEIAAEIAIKHGLNLKCVIPASVEWHKSRPKSRGVKAQAINYDGILAYKNATVVEVKKKYCGKQYMFVNFARNQYMIDCADKLIAFKRYDSTGTDDCINRANKASVEVIYA